MVLILYIYYLYLQNPSFSNKKALQQKAEGLKKSGLPLLDRFRTFCINYNIKKVLSALSLL
jgi:hypothetical protein